MSFFGREQERKELHRFLTHKGQQIGLVFGCRRVGKSELIKQSLREANVNSILLRKRRWMTRSRRWKRPG